MLTKYGDFKFTYQGETYNGRPSFEAIASIGTPEQIIHAVNLLHAPNHTYWIARKIVQHCIDGELPSFEEDEGINRLGARRASKDTRTFIINMAKHCVQHGVSGKVKDDGLIHVGDSKNEELTSFDPYEYIESAIELLGLPMSEAANLTMTEYISRVQAKPWYKEARKKDKEKGLIQDPQERDFYFRHKQLMKEKGRTK